MVINVEKCKEVYKTVKKFGIMSIKECVTKYKRSVR